jgi:hypothetical protein
LADTKFLCPIIPKKEGEAMSATSPGVNPLGMFEHYRRGFVLNVAAIDFLNKIIIFDPHIWATRSEALTLLYLGLIMIRQMSWRLNIGSMGGSLIIQ